MRARRQGAVRITFIVFYAIVMLIPMYILVISSFKSQLDILTNPLTIDLSKATTKYLVAAWNSPSFSIPKGYGTTLGLLLAVNAVTILTCVAGAYVIARTPTLLFRAILLFFVAGMFIPTQVILVPTIFVLKTLGLMGTLPGLVLFQSATMIPFTLFVFTGYIRMLPKSLDEAAAVDGAGHYYILCRIIFPLMTPIIATAFVLNSLSAWNDFASPQMILGPGSQFYTVTTGVYAAVGQYSADYTRVYPTLLLAVIPILLIFVFMQRFVMSGLAAGAVKG